MKIKCQNCQMEFDIEDENDCCSYCFRKPLWSELVKAGLEQIEGLQVVEFKLSETCNLLYERCRE